MIIFFSLDFEVSNGTRVKRGTINFEAEYSGRVPAPPPPLPPIEIYSSLFHFGGAMREPAEGRARRKNSKNFRLPERGILRAACGPPLCARHPFYFPSPVFFLRARHAWNHRPTETRSFRGKILDGGEGDGFSRALNSSTEQGVCLYEFLPFTIHSRFFHSSKQRVNHEHIHC